MTHLTNADEATADRRSTSTGEARTGARRMLWPMLFPYRAAAPRRPTTQARSTADGETSRAQDAPLRAKTP